MRILYALLQIAAAPLLPFALIWLFVRGRGELGLVMGFFGFYDPALCAALKAKSAPRCWIHAAGLGEVQIALRLIEALREEGAGFEFILSTSTEEGREFVESAALADVRCVPFPLDVYGSMSRAYGVIQPDLVLLTEMEFWPNHLWIAAARGIPVGVVNARMPEAEARRYRWLGWFFSALFQVPDMLCVQSAEDARRFRELGARPGAVRVTGSLKYDLLPGTCGDRPSIPECRPVLVGGSTWPGEEEILFRISTDCRLSERPFLVLAPRDVSRAHQLQRLATGHGLLPVLYSTLLTGTAAAAADCLILDRVGELKRCYAAATVVFVGRSLRKGGGQNPLEPVAAGAPVIFGPRMENFQEIAQGMLAAGAAIQVGDERELGEAVCKLLQDRDRRDKMTEAARSFIERNRGAMETTVRLIRDLVPPTDGLALAHCEDRRV